MSTELINCITVKKDGVYVSSHSSNDTFPYHSWRCRGLSEIYDAEGQKGLDREVIRMLYEYAELRGTHKSLARYRYAKDDPAAHAIYQKYMDKIDDRYGQMDEADQNSVWYKPTERQGSTEPMSGTCGARCIPKSLKDAGNTTRSRKTEICLKRQTLIQNKPSISEGCFSASLEKGLFCGLSWISFLFMICSGF